ncbi:MAG: hypothetical protein L0227_04530 [Chloroflexi bacterium]|nr:hypothetical protein [Chloroflexota bacterium]
MIRARAGHAKSRSAPLPILLVAILAMATLVAACIGGESPTPEPSGPGTSPTGSAVATGSDAPTDPPSASPGPTATASGTPAPQPSDPLGTPAAGCSGSEENRAFFEQASVSMAWPVYCAALPDGWFLETGSFRLASGGYLEVTYRGPGDVRLLIVEGNVCEGSDVETCAPRDAVVGPAAFGDREGELGRLGNSLVLDVDRGATPTWRATGLGLSEDAFRGLGAALIQVEG